VLSEIGSLEANNLLHSTMYSTKSKQTSSSGPGPGWHIKSSNGLFRSSPKFHHRDLSVTVTALPLEAAPTHSLPAKVCRYLSEAGDVDVSADCMADPVAQLVYTGSDSDSPIQCVSFNKWSEFGSFMVTTHQ
jgi:hypothetical protein